MFQTSDTPPECCNGAPVEGDGPNSLPRRRELWVAVGKHYLIPSWLAALRTGSSVLEISEGVILIKAAIKTEFDKPYFRG